MGQDNDAETNYRNKTAVEKEAYINQKKIEFRAYVVTQIGERPSLDTYLNDSFSGFYTSMYSGGKKRKTKKRKTKKRKTKKRINKK
jgi:hypothetical protein